MSKSYLFLKSGCTVPEETVAVTRALLGWAPIGEEKLQIFMERNENVIMENFVVIFFFGSWASLTIYINIRIW